MKTILPIKTQVQKQKKYVAITETSFYKISTNAMQTTFFVEPKQNEKKPI